MIVKRISAGVLFLVFITAVSSCKRAQLDEDLTSTEDNALALSLWDDVNSQSQNSSAITDLDSSSIRTWGNCASISFDTALGVFPNTITLDFGESGCTGRDGRIRKGKIIYTITAPYRQTGSIITTTPSDYYVNNYRVEGMHKATNNGQDASGAISYSIKVTEASITTPENEIITWESERTRRWIEGQLTGYFTFDTANLEFLKMDGVLDDVYLITGSAAGTDRNGREFKVTITDDLRLELDCRHIVSGVLELKPQDIDKRILDYGNGECDNQATVTINDHEKKITLGG